MKLALGNSLATQRIGGAAPAWTPADIADLAIFFHFKPGANCAYASNGGAAAGAGDPVGYAAPLFGASISASEATNKPTLQADGLQLDAAGLELLSLSSPADGAGAFTTYWSMIYADSQQATFLTDSSLGAYLGASSGSGSIADENLGEFFSSIDANTPALVRFDCTGLGGDVAMTTNTGTSLGSSLSNFSMTQVGGSSGFGYFNQNTANRFRLLIWVNRHIALGSAEDLLIRSWMTANDGTSL